MATPVVRTFSAIDLRGICQSWLKDARPHSVAGQTRTSGSRCCRPLLTREARRRGGQHGPERSDSDQVLLPAVLIRLPTRAAATGEAADHGERAGCPELR